MKNSILLVLAMTLFTFDHPLFAQGTAFTYQGRLQTSGSPANGNYELARLQSQLAQALTEKDLLMRHLADLEARDQALDARLARIEMSPGRNPAPLASTR
jgi:hypothetical protein